MRVNRFVKGIVVSGFLALSVLFLLGRGGSVFGQSSDECLVCHEDETLESMDGRLMGVDPAAFSKSVHGGFDCRDCHSQDGIFDDFPHFEKVEPVRCADCHEDAQTSYHTSFHGVAFSQNTPNSPDCAACHGFNGNAHQIHELTPKNAEEACRRCHVRETERYDGSVHHIAAEKGKASPGCVSCHPAHNPAYPPSVGAVNRLCESCHTKAMEQVWKGDHGSAIVQLQGKMSCASCHDVHKTHKPHLDEGTLQACNDCHPGYQDQFKGSVHEELFASGDMNCFSCHRTHQVSDASEPETYGCGQCHEDVEAEYRSSSHRLGRLRGDEIAAFCGDCHEGHTVRHADDPESRVHRMNIPETCGSCHGQDVVRTKDFVRLPVSLPSYNQSIHGTLHAQGNEKTAVCTDCHGSHGLLGAYSSESSINPQNLSRTCSQCHPGSSTEYAKSIHGRALAMGMKFAPTCSDCHNDHYILAVDDPLSEVNPQNQAEMTCAPCHENKEMLIRYGMQEGAVGSYQDSYHGWAVRHQSQWVDAAVCTDCHTKHEIRTAGDPLSSTNDANVVETCGQCHENSNPTFAASYTHILAKDKMMIHDWVRLIYIVLISAVLGGMALHNLVVFLKEFRAHRRKEEKKPAVIRMTKNELVQHMLLFLSFTGLAITGFALRYPDSWWVKIPQAIGLGEEVRRNFHRSMAIILVGTSVYHVYYLVAKRRGQLLLKAILPKLSDVGEAIQNMVYHLGLSKEKPTFGMYDYTQKAEYWALIWGTVVMALTGVVLWFPDLVTSWMPSWVVRVCNVIHYYEAILAVSAIIIWHFFYVIFLPKEYPMSMVWITGRMSLDHWNEHHGRAPEDLKGEYTIVEGDEEMREEDIDFAERDGRMNEKDETSDR